MLLLKIVLQWPFNFQHLSSLYSDLSPASAASLAMSGVPLSISTSSSALQAAAAAAGAVMPSGGIVPPPPIGPIAFGDHHLRNPLAVSSGKPLVLPVVLIPFPLWLIHQLHYCILVTVDSQHCDVYVNRYAIFTLVKSLL